MALSGTELFQTATGEFLLRYREFERGRFSVMATLTRAHLIKALHKETGLPVHDSADIVVTLMEMISERLSVGEAVKISSFGAFSVRGKGLRIGRNPRTGEKTPILPRRVVKFRPSGTLKKQVNDGMSGIGEDAET